MHGLRPTVCHYHFDDCPSSSAIATWYTFHSLQHGIPFHSLQPGIPFHSLSCLKLQRIYAAVGRHVSITLMIWLTCIFRGQRSYETYIYKYDVDIYSLYKN